MKNEILLSISKQKKEDLLNYYYQQSSIHDYKFHRKFRTQMYEVKMQNKQTKSVFVNTFHKAFIRNKYNEFTRPKLSIDAYDTNSIFITKTEETTSTDRNNSSNAKSLKLSSIYRPKKIQTASEYLNTEPTTKFNSRIADYFSILISPEENQTLSEFNSKTQTFRKVLQTQRYLENCLRQKLEDRNNQRENIDQKMFNIILTQKQLVLYFYYLSQYMSYLNGVRNAEQQKLIDLSIKKETLELENKSINRQIAKQKKLLALYKNYKVFLLMVKFKVKQLTSIPKKYIQYYGLGESLIRRKSTMFDDIPKMDTSPTNQSKVANLMRRRQTRIIVTRTPFNRGIAKKSTIAQNVLDINEKIQEQSERDFLKNKNHNYPIFEKVDDFVENFSSLEEHTYDLFRIFSEREYLINNDLYDKAKINVAISNTEKKNEEICQRVEKELKKVKERNSILQREYERISKSPEKRELSLVIFKKIKQFLLSLPINIESEYNISKFYKNINTKGPIVFIKGYKYNKILYVIKILEKILFYYISQKQNIMYENNGKNQALYIEAENNIIKQKKIEKNNQLKEQEIQKRIDRNNKIIEKYNKVLFIPKRMVFDKGIELIIKRKKGKEEKKMKESGNDDGMTNNERYDNLLTY